MQLQFKYCGKEINKEDFNKLNDVFKWVTNSTVNTVDFDSIFDGKYKSMRTINDKVKEMIKIDCDKVKKELNDILISEGFPPIYQTIFSRPLDANFRQFNNFPKETKIEEKDSVINKEEPKINAHFIRYVSDNPILEVKQFNNLQEAEDWFNHSIYEEAKYIKYGTLDIIKSVIKDKIQEIQPIGVKESQTTQKAPIFTYCKVNKNALEELSLRALYGHLKYNKNGADEDWQNFTRVANAEEEYANAQFRHALQIGGEESEKDHLVSSAWNAISRLEIYLRKNLQDKK